MVILSLSLSLSLFAFLKRLYLPPLPQRSILPAPVTRRRRDAAATTQQSRALNTIAFFLSQGPVTVDELLEMGRAKLMNHDLALEMSRLSETSETLAADKQVPQGAQTLLLLLLWLVDRGACLCCLVCRRREMSVIARPQPLLAASAFNPLQPGLYHTAVRAANEGAGEAAVGRISGVGEMPGRRCGASRDA